MNKEQSNVPSAPKKSFVTLAKDFIVAHKKPCVYIGVALLLVCVFMIISANTGPDGFTATYMPAWVSPDYKLSKKNNTGKTKRSDNKIDGWSKDDYANAVSMFNAESSTP